MKMLLSLLIAMSLYAEPLYLQDDKQKHFVGSMAIGMVASNIATYNGSNYWEALAIGIASSLLVGIAKEAIDGNGHGSEDINDIYADTAGAVLGASIQWRF